MTYIYITPSLYKLSLILIILFKRITGIKTVRPSNEVKLGHLQIHDNLVYDYYPGRLYWVAMDELYIGSARLDGSDVKRVVSTELPQPFSMTQFEEFIYWTGEC